MKKGHVAGLLGIGLASVGLLAAGQGQLPISPRETAIKYMRDSEEYATIARQMYRVAGEAVTRAAQGAGQAPWAVVLDIDETTLDNSRFQLDRALYEQPFESGPWNAWQLRHEAGVVPGVVDFIGTVRRLGGRVAWITNREPIARDATRMNLQQFGVWNDADRLCVLDTAARTKRIRRAELVAGRGPCAWAGTPVRLALFVGDQLTDFPVSDERIPGADGDSAFGRTCFLLPNPMYGAWTSFATRVR